MSYDLSLFNFLHDLAGQSKIFDILIVFFATYLPYLMVLGALVILFLEPSWRKRFRNFALTALSVLLASGIITSLIKYFYLHPRPFIALGFMPLLSRDSSPSFPSSHTVLIFAIAFAVFFFARKWGWLYLAAATLVGIARVAGGVHWPSDIIGGIAIAAISVLVVNWALAKTSK
ncbi:MAG: phosphatase PAP2 family protein [bacterium]|nr:phosphatase PAP2 family protein [bacterium]